MSNIARYKLTQEQLNNIHTSEWLTDRQRRIFELFYKRGWRIEDIAADMGIDRSTIGRELDKIRNCK